ncbi:cystathionine beta-lyase [Clostridioides difficile]|uniref:MalY/PatB family protein n=1 Tax=Clostridioides difficile TaxID=1496 RepID=UPI000BB1DA66|nr:MalY/PatB family protein [Clostridioides difficile]EGT4532561.1 pyridoxal phosphate-dependent aminotransferase [Clostridioides difficile]EGT4708695.1 pyridoxal phosphate-dependent aminotransferase [Clostridioides difficile]EGT4835813.1 pyridoxal phosphate-dependent aminotransferase [Clostridioides difficile]EGT4911371.1 pyridoxal phosphate-dependent aminotransferase [Clostridioides difficile]EGT5505317.1 pyridoxal phosphate-dependent aminotransferase [Clostridioides difficile]
MNYNFNEIVDRSNNFSSKWSEMEKKYGTNDLLPMWVADMDFKAAPCIIDSLKNRLEQEIYGYTTRPDSYNESIVNWLDRRHNWKIKSEWLIYSPGVIPAISLLINELTKANDKIMIQEPVYSPFNSVVKNNNRELIISPLQKLENGNYIMDYEDIENKIKDVKLFILCNPHNPVGRVWTKDELKKLGDICLKHNVKIISDEIHSDIILKKHKHIPTASISKEFEKNTITCMAPTKTFNIAGLQSSYVILPDEKDYKLLDDAFTRIDIKRNNCFSLVATEASYNNGESWLESFLEYLESNIDFAIKYINENMPKLKVRKPEGTYLLWVDFSALGLSDEELESILVQKGKVALNQGNSFGIGGSGYQRINLACPRSMLEEALIRIKNAIN